LTGTAAEHVTGTGHDRYPVAAHLILLDQHGQVLLLRRTLAQVLSKRGHIKQLLRGDHAWSR